MMLIKLVDARKGLHEKCIELFHDEKVAESIYMYLCDGLEECDVIEPERKTGRWIIRETAFEDIEATCSCCGFKTLVNEPGNGLHMVDDLNYCPNCGAYMKGEPNED